MPPPASLVSLLERYDADVFDAPARPLRIRLSLADDRAWDVTVADHSASLDIASGRPDATITADEETWQRIVTDLRGGMDAFRAGRLSVRRNVHAGVGFLAATSGERSPGRLRFRTLDTASGSISIMTAGLGDPVLAIHGLGGTKSSFLPTISQLAGSFQVIAMDLPGFGDSDKPLGASYDALFFARAVTDLLDALGLERANLIGNSLGGRVALEVGLREPARVARLALLAPSLAWRRERPWAPLLRLARPELGLLQVAPRPVVEAIVHRIIPGADGGWAAAGIDEFLRAYLSPAGRAAFYAAARQIYLEEPDGEQGFWTRLRALEPESLFVWGRHDKLVPLAFARHVADALPGARQLELECGHVPQVERPRQTHAAIAAFFGEPA